MTDTPRTHFGQRAQERGVTSIHGDALKFEVEDALANNRPGVIEYVSPASKGCEFFRILHLPEGPFYAVVKNRRLAVTILTQAFFASRRAGRKHSKRLRSAKDPMKCNKRRRK